MLLYQDLLPGTVYDPSVHLGCRITTLKQLSVRALGYAAGTSYFRASSDDRAASASYRAV